MYWIKIEHRWPKQKNHFIGLTQPKSKPIQIDGMSPQKDLTIQRKPSNNINKQGIIIKFVHNTFFYPYTIVPIEINDFLNLRDEYCLWSRSIHTEPKLARIRWNYFLAVIFEIHACWIMIMIDILWVFLLLLMSSWSIHSFSIKIFLKVFLFF